MANKQKQQNFIKKVKSNLCVFVCKDPNYEYITYNNTPQQQLPKEQDNFEKLLTPKLQTKSRTRLAIYYKTPTNDTFQQSNEDDQMTLLNPIHSTKLNANQKTPNVSKLPFLLMSPENNNKISSTMVYKILSKTKTEKENLSPNASEIQSSTGYSTDETTTSSFSETCEISSKFDDSSIFEIGTIYSCHVPYKAKHDGDLTIKFAERLQIIQDDGQDFVLVKNLSNNKFGYIPRENNET